MDGSIGTYVAPGWSHDMYILRAQGAFTTESCLLTKEELFHLALTDAGWDLVRSHRKSSQGSIRLRPVFKFGQWQVITLLKVTCPPK